MPNSGCASCSGLPSSRRRTIGRRPRVYDKALYAERGLIENFFCKLKQFRAIAIRCDSTVRNFLAAIHFAAAAICSIEDRS